MKLGADSINLSLGAPNGSIASVGRAMEKAIATITPIFLDTTLFRSPQLEIFLLKHQKLLGYHVSGISVGNPKMEAEFNKEDGTTKKEKIIGTAPEAQLIFMGVFQGQSTYTHLLIH